MHLILTLLFLKQYILIFVLAASRFEEARKKREERKLQRQKELEARRATKLSGGPMKLGTKKI